jgi:hypothetical protein
MRLTYHPEAETEVASVSAAMIDKTSGASFRKRRFVGSTLILLCLLLATPPFLGVQYSFHVAGYDLAFFKSIGSYEPKNPVMGMILCTFACISTFPSVVIATLFPIRGVTIFHGEGIPAPKPLVTVVFWVMLATFVWIWMRRSTKAASNVNA